MTKVKKENENAFAIHNIMQRTLEMKTFEEYLDKMGYSWNDFDRPYEMENLIDQYADERIKQALTIPHVVGRSEQLPEYELEYCGNCMQMKNHLDGICQKCK